MNFFSVASCLFLLYITVIATEGSNSPKTKTTPIAKTTSFKEAEKQSYPKKVNSIKKNLSKASLKKIADITDKFRDLPADDLAFIKELDKQFKLHGGKVKIKVENKNGTATKNSKRTIDSELGYGYAHNGYHYDPPKYMFYPYSQQDIAGNDHGYHSAADGKTEVSIEPSYSYELKSQSYLTHNEPQIDVPKPDHEHHPPQAQQQYEEPVIVLRIPGPAKYATHLQMLLQKYLEIRAAQYLHILEEAEHRNLQQQQQQHQQLQQLDYGHGNAEHIEQPQQHVAIPQQHDYTQQVQYDQQNLQYPEIDHVYHSYKHRHSSHYNQPQAHGQDTESYYATHQSEEEQQQHHYQQPQYPQEHYQYQQALQDQPQFYYTHQQQYAQPEGPPANTFHQVLLVAMAHPQPADHEAAQDQEEKQHPIYVQEQANQKEPSLSVPIAENNPRPSHTKVVFTNKKDHGTDDYQMYQLPSIKPNERHAPTSLPDFHQDFNQQQQQESSSTYQQHYNAAETADTAQPQPQVVAITQRPYNYHAHNVKARARGRTGHGRRAVTTKEADSSLEKIREYVRDKLGAETGSAVEYKTTQIIDG